MPVAFGQNIYSNHSSHRFSKGGRERDKSVLTRVLGSVSTIHTSYQMSLHQGLATTQINNMLVFKEGGFINGSGTKHRRTLNSSLRNEAMSTNWEPKKMRTRRYPYRQTRVSFSGILSNVCFDPIHETPAGFRWSYWRRRQSADLDVRDVLKVAGKHAPGCLYSSFFYYLHWPTRCRHVKNKRNSCRSGTSLPEGPKANVGLCIRKRHDVEPRLWHALLMTHRTPECATGLETRLLDLSTLMVSVVRGALKSMSLK